MESAACGLLAARGIEARLEGRAYAPPPADTMCGALLRYITAPAKDFQPMGANMGLLPSPEMRIRDKRQRYLVVAQRAVSSMEHYTDPQQDTTAGTEPAEGDQL